MGCWTSQRMYSGAVWAAKESWRGSPRSKRATAPGGDTASVLAAYGPRGAPSSAARAAAGGEASADGQTARASTSNQMLDSEARRRSRKSASPVRAELPAKGAASQRVLSTERVLEAEERTDESEAEEPGARRKCARLGEPSGETCGLWSPSSPSHPPSPSAALSTATRKCRPVGRSDKQRARVRSSARQMSSWVRLPLAV
mmetsp:Transcript_36049/g.119405  ORF Transcript_36049/g.119405 Transcript_36049/m.119405 type:complete len:201 (-) Transcript_36049:60-662(-)